MATPAKPPRNCLACIHCNVDMGSPNYGTGTPGSPGRIECNLNWWKTSATDRRSLATLLDTATDCPGFTPDTMEEAHGVWRAKAEWKELGGEDGRSWVASFEFRDPRGNWHTAESWYEEVRRPIPPTVLDWADDFLRRAAKAGGASLLAVSLRDLKR